MPAPHRFSLRGKVTLALLGVSFLAIAVVGLASSWLVTRRFNDVVVERALDGFVGEVAEYYQTYGSLEAARAAEPFFTFLSRARPGPRPPSERDRGDASTLDARPSASGNGATEATPRRRFAFGGRPPPIAVVDRSGAILLDLGRYHVGDTLRLARRKLVRPIHVDGTEIALAVPLDRPALSELEREYLAAIKDALIYALLLATALAIPIGFVLGGHLTRPVRDLKGAIAGMRAGALRQSVRVRTGDELGELSAAFNTMSEELDTTYREVEEARKGLEEQATLLTELSLRDELTRLPNRRAFDEQVSLLFKQSARYDHSLTLAMADVDHFKKVNDDFSHATGDAVLREVGALIARNVRDADIVSRYGGEEFAIAFPETPLVDAALLADRLRAVVADHDWSRLAYGLSVTLSIGLGVRGTAESFREVLDAADAKLYEAKTHGRNQVRS